MLLCLSSGFTRRYRHDILRATSAPKGAHLRFRYQLKLVSESLKVPIAENSLVGTTACLAYLDRRDVKRQPEIIPCRRAVVRSSEVLGDFCVIDFELCEFWFAPDPEAFNRDVRSKIGNLPDWDGENLKGYFCTKADSVPGSLVASPEINDWQKLIACLKNHADFADEPFFYFVQGIFSTRSDLSVSPRDRVFELDANSTYELRLVQYSPGETNERLASPDVSWILVDGDAHSISFVTNRKMVVDSGYDVKVLRFRTEGTNVRVASTISLFRHLENNLPASTDNAIWDSDLLLTVMPRTRTAIWQGLLVGGLIACQGLIAILSNEHIPEKVWTSIAVVAFGLVAGLTSSFGLRKL